MVAVEATSGRLVWVRVVDVCFASNTHLMSTQPLCNENPIAATCNRAEATCCNNNEQCSCLFLTNAADELNYDRQDKDLICKFHPIALTFVFVGLAQTLLKVPTPTLKSLVEIRN